MKKAGQYFLCVVLTLCLLLLCGGAPSETYTDLSDACRDLRACVYAGQTRFSFTLSSAAQNGRAQWEIRDILTDVLEGCEYYEITFESESNDLHVIVAFRPRPALRILNAWETGDLSGLTEDELKCLNIALAVVDECRSGSQTPLELERALYDFVCRHVEYEDGPGIGDYGSPQYIRNSTCIGALLDGKTLCLGYSEVFFLLGRLAGLDVEMQYGFPGGGSDAKHAWNTVRLGQYTYMVDACWGDTAGDPFELTTPHYGYFNVGADLMPEGRHSHPEAEIAAITPTTALEHTAFGRAGGGVVCQSLTEALEYALCCHDEGKPYAHILIPGQRISTEQIDRQMWPLLEQHKISTTWGRLTYDFADGTYLIIRWVLDEKT